MAVYVFLVIAIFIVYGVIYSMTIKNEKKKFIFLCCVGIMLVLISALRGQSVGTDTAGYWHDYLIGRSANFEQMVTEWGGNLGYYWLSSFFIKAGLPIQIWFGFVAFLYTSAVFIIIYKYSDNPLLCVIMDLSVGTFAFSLAGLKQVFAIVFVLFSFIALQKRKTILFMIMILFGSFFHSSILFFLLAYPFSYVKKIKTQVMITIFMLVITFGSGLTIIQRLLEIWDDEHYYTYITETAEYSLTGFFIQVCIIAASLILSQKMDKKKELNHILIPLALMGVVAQSLASAVASAFRLSLYFVPFSIVLFSNCLRSQQNVENRKILEYGAMVIFVSYFLYSVSGKSSISPYLFYWKNIW